jgi:UDP-N-acetylmuramate dehydrogenase
LTTFQIGGDARLFVSASTEDEVAEALALARKENIPTFILGGGSNVLIADAGFDGLVLKIGVRGITTDDDNLKGMVRLVAGAGEDWDTFVAHCVANELAGVECLSGIPGSVGGTPVQNVGAYGQEVAEVIESVRCVDRLTGEIVVLPNQDCGFSYRTSIFNSTHRDRYIVLNVAFVLRKGGQPRVAYKDLKEHFGEGRPTLARVRDAVLSIRRSKSMVIDASDPNAKSAGSFFKNPVVEWQTLREIETRYDAVPHFEFGEKVKVPAAWLIGRSGFDKGYTLGNAGISSNHNLALINRGGASAADIVELQRQITDRVNDRFGIVLKPEPVFVGF